MAWHDLNDGQRRPEMEPRNLRLAMGHSESIAPGTHFADTSINAGEIGAERQRIWRQRNPAAIKKWDAIEGLRAWLAWAVVIHHCLQAADLGDVGLAYKFYWAGPVSVFIFMIISGFVITHLIVQNKESYFSYLTRRFFRLYPLFVATCLVGALTLPLYVDGLLHVAWHSSAAMTYGKIIFSQNAHLAAQILAHATMLHGTLPDQILPKSSVTFMPPGWSLSLEWQFYLVAPAVIYIARKHAGAILLLIACALGAYFFEQGKFGTFTTTSFLPGAAPLFAVGVASRLFWGSLAGRVKYPTALAIAALSLMPVASILLMPVIIWIAFFGFLCASARPSGRIDKFACRIFDTAFKHPCALYFGERSYSIYLTHFAVLSVAIDVVANPAISQLHFFQRILALTLLGTAVVSVLSYRFIERPGISLGRAVGRSLRAAQLAVPGMSS
jgi:peptidoglycan/LPS O-acetylase OafA/YrhL